MDRRTMPVSDHWISSLDSKRMELIDRQVQEKERERHFLLMTICGLALQCVAMRGYQKVM